MHEDEEEETSSSKRKFDFVEVKQSGEVGETRLEESGKEKAGWILRIGKVGNLYSILAAYVMILWLFHCRELLFSGCDDLLWNIICIVKLFYF